MDDSSDRLKYPMNNSCRFAVHDTNFRVLNLVWSAGTLEPRGDTADARDTHWIATHPTLLDTDSSRSPLAQVYRMTQATCLLGYHLGMRTSACAYWNRCSWRRRHVQEGTMRDEHSPYRDDVYWPMEKIRQADMAAAREDRRWEERRIVDWFIWKAGAIMVLEGGTRYVIHEERAML